jgi:hypothetical protein
MKEFILSTVTVVSFLALTCLVVFAEDIVLEDFDVVQRGVAISKHFLVITTPHYQSDGKDLAGNKYCFYYCDFGKGIKIYISVEPQWAPIDVLKEGNEEYLGYLLDVSEVVNEDGGVKSLIKACKSGFKYDAPGDDYRESLPIERIYEGHNDRKL